MLRIDDITPGLALVGLEPTVIGNVISVAKIAEGTVQVIYRTPDGGLKERLLNRDDEPSLSCYRPQAIQARNEGWRGAPRVT